MLEKKIIVNNETGIHARPASLLVKEATKFKSEFFIVKDGNEYNCKSIMSVMSMGAKKGEEITVKVFGEDEIEAFEAMTSLIERGFDE
ncbi:Phosphotransferase system, phosphocarrier protein HPr [Alkaliphilus metalliredigens QYMF]|uniref:Phosphocarrier protein HPr n=1 Tax=Alkaliphilus metalliredigens (strain QYMF) TaxID=293826 RepID=A6TMP6_ALKMQ|nr:HPr family phosphocarrier protein [Alkaliphilus metalliredigens]ABR47464.1 Phosphotransferase system, phosphocarrier protein HPr [Alkaliphilus metalliredigens QYMF]